MTTPANKKPILIKQTGIYMMRNGVRANIHTIKPNDNHNVTAFTCKGNIEVVFRGRTTFRGYNIWHESGDNGAFESEYDIVEFIG